MANNIGTQAASLIEAANQTSMALACMGRLSAHMQSTVDGADWWYPIEVLTEIHNERFGKLAHYLEKEVLPMIEEIERDKK